MPIEYRRALQQMQARDARDRAPGCERGGRSGGVGMGKPTGFLEYQRRDRSYDAGRRALKHWREFTRPLPEDELRRQGGRCMDCGTPYCHTACPVNNLIPDWNDQIYRGNPRAALATLHRTNNFPGFHRPHLSRAVRGGVHAEPDRSSR